jgi:aminopeptidase N
MKKLFTFLALCCFIQTFSQDHYCAITKQKAFKRLAEHQQRTSSLNPAISHELKYDVKFVHLMLNLERWNKYIKGGVKTVATVTASSLDTFMCLLHQNYIIDSIRFNGSLVAHIRQDSSIKIKPAAAIPNGQSFTCTTYYHGTAPVGGSAIGSGYDSDAMSGDSVSWSLSEAMVAYHWWPCKQILTDKIDSSWVDVTTDSSNKAGSNGLLKNVVLNVNKKRYEWRNDHIIAYYLISVAVSNYVEYDCYAHLTYFPGDSVLVQNYVNYSEYNSSWWPNDKSTLDFTGYAMDLYSRLFGMYPFYKQKYGHCLVPIGGAMEHQTMTSTGFISVNIQDHELAHQWWGDNVTCKSWGDIWINEGFAVYGEILAEHEYFGASYAASQLNGRHSNAMSQLGGSIFFTDTLNSQRIFDSRLTYDKGGSILHTLRFVTNNDSLWFQTLRGFQNTYKNKNAGAVDFKNYYETQTSINATQFFNQWYYGEGYPTFDASYNFVNNTAIIKSIQTTSTPSSVPVFITPMEYKIKRKNALDTFVRVMHTNNTETYMFAMKDTVIGVFVDPNNWVMNRITGPSHQDTSLTDVGIKQKKAEAVDLSVTPNPSDGIFEVRLKNVKDGAFCVTDMSGKTILIGICGSHTTVDLSNKVNGVYILQVRDVNNEIIATRKLIKK